MATNITFAGTVLDKDDNAIDAKLQIFVYNKKNGLTKWSNIFGTENYDYNKNAGDSDISGQENTLGLSDASNEFIIIAAWKDGTRDSITDIPSEFAYIVHELKGDELYIQNIKLGIPLPIDCSNWEVPESIIQGESIVALNHNTNDMSYMAEGITHYLYNKYSNTGFNEVIFPFIGPSLVQFNFNNEGYSQSNVYIPENGGDYSVDIEVNDYFGNQKFCHKTTKVYYEVQCGFNDSEGNYKVNDNIYIENAATGHTNKIVTVSYNINDEIIELENTHYKLNTFGVISVTQYITYFNAYENIDIECHRDIVMENIPPELVLAVIKEPINDSAKKDYEFAHNGTDIDGYIEKVEWQIHRNNPDINGNENWSLYYTTGPITDLSDWSYNMDNIIGDLKVRAIVYDNLGASAQEDYLIENNCSDIMMSFDNIDWTKNIRSIDFNQTVVKNVWKQEVKKVQWNMKTVPITWDNTAKKIQWIQVAKGIKFNYKIYTKI